MLNKRLGQDRRGNMVWMTGKRGRPTHLRAEHLTPSGYITTPATIDSEVLAVVKTNLQKNAYGNNEPMEVVLGRLLADAVRAGFANAGPIGKQLQALGLRETQLAAFTARWASLADGIEAAVAASPHLTDAERTAMVTEPLDEAESAEDELELLRALSQRPLSAALLWRAGRITFRVRPQVATVAAQDALGTAIPFPTGERSDPITVASLQANAALYGALSDEPVPPGAAIPHRQERAVRPLPLVPLAGR